MAQKGCKPTALEEHQYYGFMVASFYGAVSITLTLFNKAVFRFYSFQFPITLFIAQMCFSLLFTAVLKFRNPHKYGFPVTWALAKQLLPMALGWVTYGISGIIALKYLNVPMFSAFRRFTTIMVMYGEYQLRGRLPPGNQQAAVLVMCVGAMMSGLTDLAFSLPGYCWVFTCAASTALYLLFIDKLGRESGLNDFGLLFYNNALSLPFMLIALVFSGELSEVPLYPRLYDLDFQIFFVVSAMQAFLLNFMIFLCTRVNSPLITAVTGTAKDLFLNILGMTLFGDFPYNPPNLAAICVCFSGSAWYSWLKYLTNQKPKPKEDAKEKNK